MLHKGIIFTKLSEDTEQTYILLHSGSISCLVVTAVHLLEKYVKQAHVLFRMVKYSSSANGNGANSQKTNVQTKQEAGSLSFRDHRVSY